ncbi:hypothetical protein GCM10022295_90270 [Streptomyces osmaniensis]|uniref:Uncharacterized protein n=1 Tax=Streptomyces osmaniensis TaxID=593134 RepID=A0ABP6YZH2_9ACTN
MPITVHRHPPYRQPSRLKVLSWIEAARFTEQSGPAFGGRRADIHGHHAEWCGGHARLRHLARGLRLGALRWLDPELTHHLPRAARG